MDLKTLTDEDLDTLHVQVLTEQERRRTITDSLAQAVALADRYAAAIGRKDGDPWQAPTGAHDAYQLDAIVTDAGKMWISLTPANVWRPGESGWREVVADGYPEWVQPTGANDAYNVGNRVSFEGSNYESTTNGNVWSPTVYPTGWSKL